jgi:hypothetical protein
VDVKVYAAVGTHTLHVKTWGNKGAVCVTDVAITVSTSATAPVTPAASVGLTVSSPSTGQTVSSPFILVAKASSCSSQPVASIGYSLDNSSNTTIVRQTSISVPVSAAAGAHTLHVKTWGNKGSACATPVTLTVSSSAASSSTAPATTSSSAGLSVASPSNGQTVSSPFTLSADASSCSSQAVSSIGYSLDNSSDTTIIKQTSVDTKVSASAGTHTLHVKTWGDKGASCSTAVAINVSTITDDVAANSSIVPSSAISVSGIHALSSWSAVHDTGTPGSSSGKMTMVSSPAHSGPAREFATSFSSSGGERYSVSFGDDRTSTNFLYDTWIYLASPSTKIANIELDLYQTMSNGQTVLFGFQCDGYSGTWDYNKNSGTASNTHGTWVNSSAKCNPRSWTTGAWHHVQIQYSRTSAGNVNYQAVWLDSVKSTINATVFSAHALGWGSSLVTNFQIDGLGSGSATVYLDDLTVYRW